MIPLKQKLALKGEKFSFFEICLSRAKTWLDVHLNSLMKCDKKKEKLPTIKSMK